MARAVCYLETDLSLVALVVDGKRHDWRRPEPGEDEAVSALWWRAQADAAAQFITDRLGEGGRKPRLDLVVTGVSEASCFYVSAPSDDATVVAASLAQSEAGLDELGVVGAIQPLTDPSRGAGPAAIPFLRRPAQHEGVRRFPAISSPDALVRLWLDALDRAGCESLRVTSLWHLAAATLAPTPADLPPDARPLAAVVLEHDGRLLWCWGRGGALRCAGAVTLTRLERPAETDQTADDAPPPADERPADRAYDLGAAIARLSLDWLTWSAQVGEAPSLVVAAGPHAGALTPALERAWPEGRIEARTDDDPIGLALRLSDGVPTTPANDSDPRRVLLSLTRRRGRAHRWLYTASGAALALLAVGIGAFGMRARDHRAGFEAARAEVAVEVQGVVRDVAPSIADRPDRVTALQSELVRLRQARPDFTEPDPALPVLDELERIASVFNSMRADGGEAPEGRDDALRLDELTISEAFPNGSVTVPGFAEGEDLRARLAQATDRLRWSVNFQQQLGGEAQRWRLTGEWLFAGGGTQ